MYLIPRTNNCRPIALQSIWNGTWDWSSHHTRMYLSWYISSCQISVPLRSNVWRSTADICNNVWLVRTDHSFSLFLYYAALNCCFQIWKMGTECRKEIRNGTSSSLFQHFWTLRPVLLRRLRPKMGAPLSKRESPQVEAGTFLHVNSTCCHPGGVKRVEKLQCSQE